MNRKVRKNFHFSFPITQIKNNGHLTFTHAGDAICKGYTTLEVEFTQKLASGFIPVLPLVIEVFFDSIILHDTDIKDSIDQDTLTTMREAAKLQNFHYRNYQSLINKQSQSL